MGIRIFSKGHITRVVAGALTLSMAATPVAMASTHSQPLTPAITMQSHQLNLLFRNIPTLKNVPNPKSLSAALGAKDLSPGQIETLNKLIMTSVYLYEALSITGGLPAVQQAESRMRDPQVNWYSIIYGTPTSPSPNADMLVAVIQDLLTITFSGTMSSTDSLIATLEQIKRDIQTIDPNATTDDIYNFFENFKTSVELQAVQSLSGGELDPSNISVTSIVIQGLEDAVGQTVNSSGDHVFQGLLSTYGLTTDMLHDAKQRATQAFDPDLAASQALIAAMIAIDELPPDQTRVLQNDNKQFGLYVDGLVAPVAVDPNLVTWDSSNPDIAITQDGTISTTTLGTTTLTAYIYGYPVLEFDVSVVDPSTVVAIPDQNLLAALQSQFGLAVNDVLLKDDLTSVDQLDLQNSGIQDLTGLENATNLTSILLNGNQITDLTPLAHLSGLDTLDLAHNSIQDLKPITGLTNLKYLSLQGNQIQDIKPLAGLSHLYDVQLEGNQLTDIQPLVDNFNAGGLQGGYVFLAKNPLTLTTAVWNEIKQLQNGGVTVDFDYNLLTPTNLQGTWNNGALTLTWGAVSAVSSYLIYEGDSTKPIASVRGTSYTVPNFNPSAPVEFRVTAANGVHESAAATTTVNPAPAPGQGGNNGGSTGNNGGSTGNNGGSTGNNGGSTGNNGGSTGNNGGSTDNNGGSTDNNGGSTDNNGGSTDNNGGSTDNNGGSTDNNGGGKSTPGGTATTYTSAQKQYNHVVSAKTFGTQAGSLSAKNGTTTVQLSVPAGTFSKNEKITLTSANTASVSKLVAKALPKGFTIKVSLGVNFTGPTPKKPITLSITDKSIPANANVYKITNKGLVAVKATVKEGKITISFKADPDFVVIAPAVVTRTAPKSVNEPTVKLGSHGTAVVQLQKFLHIKADGIFGPATMAAVKKFQVAHHLAANGVVDAKTWAALVK